MIDHPILSVPVPTDEDSAIRALMLLHGLDLMWHPDERAADVMANATDPLFPKKRARKHADLVMDAICEQLDDPYAVSNDLHAILNGGIER